MGAENLHQKDPGSTPPKIYEYVDYRQFLNDYYIYRKGADPKFSYSVFSRGAGFDSDNYIKQIINGDRNIASSDRVKGIGQVVGFDQGESEYFSLIVNWDQCKTDDEQINYWEMILKSRPEIGAFSAASVHILSNWKAIALLEMVRLKGFRLDPAWIKRKFLSEISRPEIRETFQRLEEAGLIIKKGQSFEVTNKSLFAGGAKYPSQIVQMYHQQIMKAASNAIKTVPMEQREFSSSTFSLSQREFNAIQAEIRKFKRRIHQILDPKEAATRVYHMNLQLYPVTEGEGDDE